MYMASIDHKNWMVESPFLSKMNLGSLRFRVSTDRYYDKEYHASERTNLWMRVWQIVGRVDEIPTPGDWLEYRLFDQSWLVVRGRDGIIRGFVNACRHRGNRLGHHKGQSARFHCPYHNWSFGLDGTLIGVAKPDFEGSLEEFVGSKESLGLLEVPVECFGGFLFLNPDVNAPPLKEFLGEAYEALSAYPLEHMTPVGINVRERVECNWKVILDAFGEGYHTQGVHRELIGVVDLQKERFKAFGLHSASTTPFGKPDFENFETARAIDEILQIPISHFPGFIDVLPRFKASVDHFLTPEGNYALPGGTTPTSLLRDAVRENLESYGLDVSKLDDSQMTDYQFWLLFPNVFLQLCAGEATLIIAEPDPMGDPNRCFWRVMTMRCLSPNATSDVRAELIDMPEGEHFPYFLALQQDFEQMAIQQDGLRNTTLKELSLTRQEPRVANFHGALDSWMNR